MNDGCSPVYGLDGLSCLGLARDRTAISAMSRLRGKGLEGWVVTLQAFDGLLHRCYRAVIDDFGNLVEVRR